MQRKSSLALTLLAILPIVLCSTLAHGQSGAGGFEIKSRFSIESQLHFKGGSATANVARSKVQSANDGD